MGRKFVLPYGKRGDVPQIINQATPTAADWNTSPAPQTAIDTLTFEDFTTAGVRETGDSAKILFDLEKLGIYSCSIVALIDTGADAGVDVTVRLEFSEDNSTWVLAHGNAEYNYDTVMNQEVALSVVGYMRYVRVRFTNANVAEDMTLTRMNLTTQLLRDL